MQRPQPKTITLNDILITEELSQRSPRLPNLQAENQAMRSLARQMARDSQSLMQTLADTALELCQAGTAGVSLLETPPDGEEIFRWTVLAGTLAHHVGGTTPRNFSPCGVCLNQGTPVLFGHPEFYFTYFQKANTPVVEGLVLPLIADDHVLGTIWIMSHDEARQFDSEDVRVMTSLADFTATALLLNQRQTRELLAVNATLEAEVAEHQQTEAKLREAQKRLELSLTGANLGIWTYHVGTDEFWADDRAQQMHGHEPDEVHTFAQAGENIHPDDRDRAQATIAQAVQDCSKLQLEYRVIWRDGSIHWIASYAEFVLTGEQDQGMFYGVAQDITEAKRDEVERQQVEAALRESEVKYRSLFESIDEGFCIFEMIYDKTGKVVDYRFLEVNPVFERQTGLENPVGKLGSKIIPNTESYWLEAYDEVIKTGKPQRIENYNQSTDRWYSAYASRVGGEGSRQACTVFNDITERKRTEEQLRRAAEMDAFRVKLSDALRSLSDPVQIQAEACRLLGEQLGVDRAYYTEINETDNYIRVEQNYLRGNSPSVVGVYPVSAYSWLMPLFRRGQTVVIADIENSDLVPESDQSAMSMLQVLAFAATPLVKAGVLVGALTISESEPREWTDIEVELTRETGERIWAAIERAYAERALRDSEIQRIQEQAAREEARQRAESLAELDRAKTLFFSNISHEFRTPLTLSLSPLQDVLSDRIHPLDPIHRDRLELVHRNSLRLLKLVNTLLDFSRIEAGRMEAVYESTDLSTFTAELAGVFRSAIERAGLQLIVDCPSLPKPVFVDREMWEKIVLNLLSNAFKFTFEGAITVRLRPTDRNQALLQIQDTGTGIAPEHLPHLFERFYQVRGTQARTHEGSGIGLALVHELVRLHGGTIEVSSTVEEGTCFAIALPFGTDHLPSVRVASPQENRLHLEGDRIQPVRTLASTAMGATSYVEEAERWLPEQGNREELSTPTPYSLLSTPPSAHVLLVDDNADMREYLTRILSEHVQVEAVADGATALAVAQERTPDLILSDVMMPGLDGFGLLEALRANPQTREVPIILLSARAGEEAIVEGLEAGADDYLIKPFSAQELLSRVMVHLQMAQLRGEALQQERIMNRQKDEFISVVSHELNTPLVSILGWTRMLRSNPPNPVMLSKALDTIERNATLQGKLVQDLLDLSRITAGKLRLNPQPIELKPVIETAIATVAQTAANKGINLTWQENVTEPVVVMGDSDRLQQVVCNLLTNAIKFTPESGQIHVELKSYEFSVLNDELKEPATQNSKLKTQNSPNYAEIRVIDTGIGISADFLPHVFDRFRQAEDVHSVKGLGLGLAIAHHIVELHDGTIYADSAGSGQGATFTVRLPLFQSSDDLT